MEKVGKPMIISVIISIVIFAFCRYVNFCTLSGYNESYNFGVAFMFGISYSSLIWAYECYRKMPKILLGRNAGLICWFKETSFFYMHVVIALCLLLIIHFGISHLYYLVPLLVGYIIFPGFYFAAYFLIVKLSGNCRVGLITGLVLCTAEFIQINFTDPADNMINYDVLNLFSGFARLYYYNSFFWLFKIILVIILMYTAAVTVTKKDCED